MRTNYEAWLHGMYCYNALCCALQNAFRQKNDPPAKYPEKPYELFKREKTEAEKQKEAEEERKKAIAYFNSFAKHKKKLEFQDAEEEADRLKAASTLTTAHCGDGWSNWPRSDRRIAAYARPVTMGRRQNITFRKAG